MVVMDELPTASLLGADGRIDAARLPNFARLAREGTWYPNTTTVADQTTAAVPALLSGRRSPREIRAPDLEAWPRNLFTLLGRQYRLDVREPVTRLCPAEACPAESRSTADAVGALASETSQAGAAERGAGRHRAARAADRGRRGARSRPRHRRVHRRPAARAPSRACTSCT